MAESVKTAITPTRQQDYPEWYQQVVKAGELAENSPVRGCMVIKPWGYGIWENIQRELDDRIKATGHENAYFPLFIPLSYLEKESSHVEGFAKECAVVTHHRLEAKDGKLIPTGPLDEPYVVRPTSETIIGEMFAKWVQSYRDLPLLINQWANVVRWEMRTRLFLRTAEFLWQEGHTAHATEVEARQEVNTMLEVYREFCENILAMPVIMGEKSADERFPGAVQTLCIEAMMQDRKALQAGTSHYLGQNFAKAAGIQFAAENGSTEFAHTTSWGVSTRLIGGLIMIHGDDDGMRVPPRVSPKHCVVIPVIPKEESRGAVLEYADKVQRALSGALYCGRQVVSTVDCRDMRGGDKSWQWIKRGIPVRIEVGPRDIEAGKVVLFRRDRGHKEKLELTLAELAGCLPVILDEIQQNMFEQAKAHRDQNIINNVNNFEDFKRIFTPQNSEKPEVHGGFVRAKWCEDPATVDLLADLKVTIRCLPLEQSGTEGKCVLTGRPATKDAIFAKSY